MSVDDNDQRHDEPFGAGEAFDVEAAIIGSPGVAVASAPPDSRAAALLPSPTPGWNGAQLGSPALVPYSFATRDRLFYADSGTPPPGGGFRPGLSEALDAAQRASVAEALAVWERACGITFIEVPDPDQRYFGGVRFALESLPAPWDGATWRALPAGAEIVAQRGLYADAPLRPGSTGFEMLLHEIGHAIGLKHPFEGSPNLPPGEDNSANTVMSYNNLGNYARLGPVDAAAARHLYGTPEAAAAAPVRWARGADGSLVTIGDDTDNVITGLPIRDAVRAGGGNDFIRTGGGDDAIRPGTGADVVEGGAGFDTVWAETPRRHAALGQDPEGRLFLALPGGTDRLDSVETIRFFDGQAAFHADLPAGQAYRLYGAALGRAPDPIGLGRWTADLESGATTLSRAAADFAGSAEFAARYGAPDAAGFVTLLYANVLGRAPDAAGLRFWTDSMAAGEGRAPVLLAFSESAEHRAKTAAAFAAGLWVPDPEAVDVLRAYVAVLDRLPDAGGLASWTAAREAGLGQSELVGRFVSSPEFQARFGGLSNRDFVEQLYRTALDREPDPDGAAAWTRALDTGADGRAGVASGFAASSEMAAKLTPLVADGILIA